MLSRKIAVLCVSVASLWSLCFVLLGNTPRGKQWYGHLASEFFDDAKGGLPVVTLCIPLLMSGSLAVLLNVRPDYGASGRQQRTVYHHCPHWIHRLIQRWYAGFGDSKFSNFAILFILAPLATYLVTNIHRHLYGNELDLDDKLSEIANSFGMMAVVAFAYMLVPVARHSAILKLLNWNPAAAIQLHIWSGRIIFFGILVHGPMHMYRWYAVAGESLFSMLIPPASCWTLKNTDFVPQCVDSDTECTCYDHFRNLTGFLALVALLVIGGTSLNYVRRYHYRLFYMTHVLAGPMMIIMAVLHWNRSILYMAPSLLYYAASSAPVQIETRRKVKHKQGVKIISVQHMSSTQALDRRQRSCVSMTFEASDIAMQQFRPGQYIKLLAPEIAYNYHPFTVNRVPDKDNQLRVIFRATGSFTYKLADRLLLGAGKLPLIHIDGFHGPYLRVNQVLMHDVAVLVAGGIGITPYLSLLFEVKSVLSARSSEVTDVMIPEVILHWICRDMNLVQYVREHYLEPILQSSQSNSSFRLRLIVHKTNISPSGDVYTDDPETTPELDEETIIVPENSRDLQFTPTIFSSGSRMGISGNVPLFVTFLLSAWIGLWSIWYLYSTVMVKHEVASRAWGLVALVGNSFFVGVLANLLAGWCCTGSEPVLLPTEGRLHDGLWWSSVGEEDESRIEMERIEDGGTDGLSLEGEDAKAGLAAEVTHINPVTYEERLGRPTVHELLKSTNDARSPGLFVCGPSQLVKGLKDAAEERCLIRMRQCLSGTPHIAIYEETFEL